jgi:predicted MPP superfamily phosphohydrolase
LNLRLTTAIGLVIVQAALYWIVSRHLRHSGEPRWIRSFALTALGVTSVPVLVFALWEIRLQLLPHWVIYASIYPLYLWHCSSVLLLLAWIVGQVVKAPVMITRFMLRKRNGTDPAPASAAPQSGPVDPRRRVFLRQSVAASAGLIFAGSAYATYRSDDYEVNEITIPVVGLPEAFHGFSIALISDIHSSVFMLKEQMQEYAAVVNSLGADLIAVPGDFVNSMLDEVYPFAEAFATLRAPYGVFGVLGNHDFYTRQVNAVAAEVSQCGIRLLRNENVAIERGGAQISLVGIDDASSFRASIPFYERATAGVSGAVSKILLCHRPIFFDQAASRGVGLMLAGHTHGGQVVFGRVGDRTFTPVGISSRYIAGLYEKEASKMYVSRGVGTVGIPLRINCPPEVTKVILSKA